jgi:integrase
MSVGRITLSSISKLDGFLWDQTCVGFGVRKQAEKGIFYYVRYRHQGKQRVHSIGRHGRLTPDTARQRARQLLGSVAMGTDPFAQSLSSEAFGPEVARYLERRKASIKPKTYIEVTRHLTKYCAPLAGLKLADIDRRKVATLLAEVETTSGIVSRNRVRASLSAFFSFAVAEGLVEHNPVTGTLRANEGGSRERVLSHEEIVKLWRGLRDERFDDIVRLLLLTGQRREEIGGLRWGEVGKGTITLPPERVKNSRVHCLPLSRQALAIIERQPRRNSDDYVFGKSTNWHIEKSALDARIGIAPYRLHDLRRTCATMCAELGVRSEVVEAILNHYSGHRASVAGTYNRAKYSDEMRVALQRYADWLDKITEDK